MNKKGDISFHMIVFAIIALLVLILVIMIFRQQIFKVSDSFTDISDEAGCRAEVSTSALGGIFGEQECKDEEDKCEGDSCYYKCVNGKFQLDTTCRSGKICAKGGCVDKK